MGEGARGWWGGGAFAGTYPEFDLRPALGERFGLDSPSEIGMASLKPDFRCLLIALGESRLPRFPLANLHHFGVL